MHWNSLYIVKNMNLTNPDKVLIGETCEDYSIK